MVCIYSHSNNYCLIGNVMKYFIFLYSTFSFLENDFCSPNLFMFSKVSERTGKLRVLEGKTVSVGSLGGFLFRQVIEIDCVAILEEESSGS